MPIQAVVFDLFDTLVDLHMEKLPRIEICGYSLPASASALFEVLSRRSSVKRADFAQTLSQVDAEFFQSRYARGLELPTRERFAAVVERLGLGGANLAARLTEVHMAQLLSQVAVPSHHAELLQQLGRSLKLAVCSNFSDAATAIRVLEEAGLRGQFDVIAISETIGIRKPRGEIFEAVRAELDLPVQAILHVGDNLRADVEGAASFGFETTWITRRIADPDRALAAYDGPAPAFQLDDLAGLPEVISKLATMRNTSRTAAAKG